MASAWRFLSIVVILIITVAIAFSTTERVETSPQELKIICQVDTVSTGLSNNNIRVPVYVTNLSDSIYGFQVWLNINELNFLKFKTDSIVGDEYFAKFDTVGTRIRGWEFVAAKVMDDEDGQILRVAGTCDNGGFPVHPPLAPGSGIMFYMFLETQGTLGDSLCDSARIYLNINNVETRFSDPYGDVITYSCTTTVETTFTNCAEWVGGECVNWFDTTVGPGEDCFFDPTKGIMIDGSIGFACCKCGDADGNGLFTISDAVYLVTFIFGGGPSPNPSCNGDADGNGIVTISDAVYIVTFIFGGGPAPHC